MPGTMRREIAPARDVHIRPATDRDLPAISALFTPPLDVARLRWLLADRQQPGALRSLVAAERERVVGHVGYTVSRFHTPRGELTGLFCINWAVDKSCRGLRLGQRLFEKTFPLADFSYEYGGTAFSRKLFLDMGFEQPMDLSYFVKVLRPLPYRRILIDPWPRRIAKVVVLAALGQAGCRPWRPTAPAMALVPFHAGALAEKAGAPYVANVTPAAQVAWYLDCPGVRSSAFTVTAGGTPIGTAVCLMRDHPTGTRTGRILHLSYLGEEVGRWRGAVALLESWLRDQGCAMISAYACHRHLRAALRDRGFLARWHMPFWLRDPHHGLPRTGWHLTGFEGDVGDRRV